MSKDLSTKLEEFDYIKENKLPDDLLVAVRNGEMITSRLGLCTLGLRRLFFIDDRLRYGLLSKVGTDYNDQTLIPALYVGEHHRDFVDKNIIPQAGYIFYDPNTGKRLGDDLNINSWFLE